MFSSFYVNLLKGLNFRKVYPKQNPKICEKKKSKMVDARETVRLQMTDDIVGEYDLEDSKKS